LEDRWTWLLPCVQSLSRYLFVFCLHPLTESHLHKIQASGQRIEYFEKLQINCKINEPLRIPLHSNVRWGSAYNMLKRALQLRQVSPMVFITFYCADLNSLSISSSNRLMLCMDLSQRCAVMDELWRRSPGVHFNLRTQTGNG
jgi:hypothetical protein